MKIDYEKYKDIKIDKERFKDIPTNVEQLRNCLAICYVLMEDKDKEIERLNNIINKAIEYINSDEMLKLREEFEYCNDKDLFDEFAGHLDRILRGSDKE